jgi:hypothetical protein
MIISNISPLKTQAMCRQFQVQVAATMHTSTGAHHTNSHDSSPQEVKEGRRWKWSNSNNPHLEAPELEKTTGQHSA